MQHFVQVAEGSDQTVLQLAEKAEYQVVTRATELNNNGSGRLLGLFSPGTMPVKWRGEDGRVAEKTHTQPVEQIALDTWFSYIS